MEGAHEWRYLAQPGLRCEGLASILLHEGGSILMHW